ncbi:MAG: M23 family metallopeptidase [Bdellovibrionota bacterium]|nr:M23 family metallopeptidase [Bdellovibrionota bacterium]
MNNYRTARYRPATYSGHKNIQLGYPLRSFKITRGFAPYKKSHYGVDFAAPRGNSVFSTHSGRVIYTGSSFRGYGKLVIVEHPNGYASFYAHLERITAKLGDLVDRGQRVGLVGDSGNARGVHLHYELRIDEKAADPSPYFHN